ncbi:MAG: hypothetical protein ACRBF0_17455 [Calditrichia bacterium]
MLNRTYPNKKVLNWLILFLLFTSSSCNLFTFNKRVDIYPNRPKTQKEPVRISFSDGGNLQEYKQKGKPTIQAVEISVEWNLRYLAISTPSDRTTMLNQEFPWKQLADESGQFIEGPYFKPNELNSVYSNHHTFILGKIEDDKSCNPGNITDYDFLVNHDWPQAEKEQKKLIEFLQDSQIRYCRLLIVCIPHESENDQGIFKQNMFYGFNLRLNEDNYSRYLFQVERHNPMASLLVGGSLVVAFLGGSTF